MAGADHAAVLFLLAPLIVVLVVSFDTSPFLTFPPKGFSFQSYVGVLHNEAFLRGFQVSLVVGLVVTVLATGLGVAAALALTRHRFAGRGAAAGFFVSPLLMPHVVLGLALLLLLGPAGLTATYPGLVLAHLGITVPYVIRTVVASLSTADTRCEEAARVLGADAFTTFRRVTLPLIRPGVLAGAVISFLISFDEAVISMFITGPATSTLPVELMHYVEYRTDPQVAALSVCLVVISVVAVVLVERRRLRGRAHRTRLPARRAGPDRGRHRTNRGSRAAVPATGSGRLRQASAGPHRRAEQPGHSRRPGAEQDAGLAITQEAVGYWRRLAKADPAAHLDGLAIALANLGVRLSELGRLDDAITHIREAIRGGSRDDSPAARRSRPSPPRSAGGLADQPGFGSAGADRPGRPPDRASTEAAPGVDRPTATPTRPRVDAQRRQLSTA